MLSDEDIKGQTADFEITTCQVSAVIHFTVQFLKSPKEKKNREKEKD